MDDLSLEALQAALVSVQESKVKTRLSERNVVELVNKLQELGLLDSNLLHSIQGKEYITPDQLCEEIKTAVADAGGRLAVADLPAQVGVDLAHCERQAEVAVQSSNGTTRLIQSELMTDIYFNGIAAEIGDLLRDTGVVLMGDMARRFKLGSELMQATITARLGGAINGRLDSGILYTPMYIERVKSQLRGALRGASRPVNLAALSKSLDLAATGSSGKMVQSSVDELVAEGAVSGTVKAGTFVPAIFAKAQQQAVQDFYAQNGFIEVEMLERLGVQDQTSYMAAAHRDSLALDSIFISPQLVTQLSAVVEEAVAAGQWTDALASLPTAVQSRDASAILLKAFSDQTQGKILAGTCIISTKLLEELQARCLSLAREAAEAAIQSRRASAKAASTSAPEASQAGGRQLEGKSRQTAAPADSDEDDWDTGRSGNKKKKGGRKKPSAKQKATLPASTQSSKAKQGSASGGDHAEALTLASLAAKVEEWLPEAAGAGEEGGFPEAVAEQLRPAALAQFEEAQAAIFLAGAETRRRKRDAIAKAIDEASQRFQLYANGAELFKEDENTYTILQRHLLKSAGQNIADLLLRHHEVDLKEDESETAADDKPDQFLRPFSASERSHLLSTLPADAASASAAADRALNSGEFILGWEALQEAASMAGLQLRKLDKKAEKALVLEQKASLSERLSSEDDPAAALSLAVPLFVAQVSGKAVSIPGKALSGVISYLKKFLPGEKFLQLRELHGLVVEDLRSQSGQRNPRLIEVLPELKDMAGLNVS